MDSPILKCIVLEDEPLAANKLVSYIEKTPFLEHKATFDNPLVASKWLESNSVDLAFTDIQMPKLNGMEWAKTVKNKILIVFTTAFDQYAIEGFRVNAIHYLLKPFSYSEFLESAEKAYNIFVNVSKNTTENSSFLFLKSGSKKIRLDYSEILYFKGADDYLEVFTLSKKWLVYSRFSELLIQLPNQLFARVHRSYIVNKTKIDALERTNLIINGQKIPISRTYRNNIGL